jgi:hypothetical protein
VGDRLIRRDRKAEAETFEPDWSREMREDVMIVVQREDDPEAKSGGFPVPIEPIAGDVLSLSMSAVNLDGRFVVLRREIETEGDESVYPVVIVVPVQPPKEDVVAKFDNALDEWQLACDGETDEETHVKCWWRPGPAYGRWKVEVDGELVRVVRVERRRDGGTTILQLIHDGGAWPADGYQLIFPRRMGSDDRTPRFAGRKVE